jgi:hypothetical protein
MQYGGKPTAKLHGTPFEQGGMTFFYIDAPVLYLLLAAA